MVRTRGRPVDLVRSPLGRLRNHHPAAHRDTEEASVRQVLPVELVGSGPPWDAGFGDPDSRLSFLAVYGPLSIVLLLVLWALLMIVAFALIYHGLGPRFQAAAGSVGFGALLYMSASTFLTLGLGDVTSSDAIARLFILLEAGTGYIFLC